MATHLISIYLCFVAITTDFTGFVPSPCHKPPFCRKYGIFSTRYCPIIMDQDDHISKFEDVSQDGGVVSHYTPTIFSSIGFIGLHRIHFWVDPTGTAFFSKNPSIKMARRQSSSKSRPCTLDKLHILRDCPLRKWMIWFPLKTGIQGTSFWWEMESSAPTIQAFRLYSLGISGGYTSKLSKFSTKIFGFFSSSKPPLTNNHHHYPSSFFSYMKNSHDTELTDRNLTARLLLADLCLTTFCPSMDRHSGDRDRRRGGGRGGLGGGGPGGGPGGGGGASSSNLLEANAWRRRTCNLLRPMPSKSCKSNSITSDLRVNARSSRSGSKRENLRIPNSYL